MVTYQQDSVQVLLSTWNGERWLPELLNSLLHQSYQNWQLIIRDDGSTDQTPKLIAKWQECYPEKIIILNDTQHIGSKHSFSRLVQQSTARYLMFCDQDDVWQNNKIDLQMMRMREKEQRYGKATPVLVHSDLAVVDKSLKIKHSSFWQLRDFKLTQSKQQYLVQNVVTGSTCLFNRVAAELAFPLSSKAMEHDRWLALCVAWFGVIDALDLPLVSYRQHGRNQIGAFVNNISIRNSAMAWSMQADYFLHCFEQHITQQEQQHIESLATLYKNTNWLQRRMILIKEKIRKDGLIPNIALMLWV